MSNDDPGPHDWANPGQAPPPPPPYVAAPGGSGWATAPPPSYGSYHSGGAPHQYGWPSQAPKPGIIPLRPLGLGEILDGAFTTIRRYPKATLGLAALVMLVVEAAQVLTQYYLLHGVTNTTTNSNGTFTSTSGDFAARTLSYDGIVFVIGLVATALLSGMLAAVVAEGALGRPMSASQAWTKTRAAFWRLLGATGLVFLIEAGIGIVCLAPGFILLAFHANAGALVLLIFGAFAGFAAWFWVEVMLLFTTPALMLEKQGITESMSRSRALVKGSWWRIFGIQILAVIIAGVISGVLVVPFALAGGLGSILSGHPSEQFTFGHLLITAIGGFLAGTLVRPFTAGVIALLYLDRRMRAEALDLTLQQAAAKNPS